MRNPSSSDRKFQVLRVSLDGRFLGYFCLVVLGFILIVSLFTKPTDMENNTLDLEKIIRKANLLEELSLEELSILVLTPRAIDQVYDAKTREKILALNKFGQVSRSPWQDSWNKNCVDISQDPETAIGHMNSWVKAGKTGLYPCIDGIQGALLKFVYTKDGRIFFGGHIKAKTYSSGVGNHVDIKLSGINETDILWGGQIKIENERTTFLVNSESYDPNRTSRYQDNDFYFDELASFKEAIKHLFGKETILSK